MVMAEWFPSTTSSCFTKPALVRYFSTSNSKLLSLFGFISFHPPFSVTNVKKDHIMFVGKCETEIIKRIIMATVAQSSVSKKCAHLFWLLFASYARCDTWRHMKRKTGDGRYVPSMNHLAMAIQAPSLTFHLRRDLWLDLKNQFTCLLSLFGVVGCSSMTWNWEYSSFPFSSSLFVVVDWYLKMSWVCSIMQHSGSRHTCKGGGLLRGTSTFLDHEVWYWSIALLETSCLSTVKCSPCTHMLFNSSTNR